jgi:hypothetical protein
VGGRYKVAGWVRRRENRKGGKEGRKEEESGIKEKWVRAYGCIDLIGLLDCLSNFFAYKSH